MFEVILVILYSILALTGKILIICKKKAGFIASIASALLQVLHVIINIKMAGLLIIAFGILIINTYALRSEIWEEDDWI